VIQSKIASWIIATTLLVNSGILIILAFIIKDKYSKVLAINSFTTVSILLIVFLSLAIKEASLLDAALVYAFINFIATIGISKLSI